jgi:hypothetical protein
MTLLLTQEEFNQARSATLSLSGGDSVDGSITNANESAALPDDADSIDPPSSDGSIITTLFDGSITRVQSDWCREYHLEPLSYLESESEGGVWEEPGAVLMAGSALHRRICDVLQSMWTRRQRRLKPLARPCRRPGPKRNE